MFDPVPNWRSFRAAFTLEELVDFLVPGHRSVSDWFQIEYSVHHCFSCPVANGVLVAPPSSIVIGCDPFGKAMIG